MIDTRFIPISINRNSRKKEKKMSKFKKFAAVGCSILLLFASLAACDVTKSSAENLSSTESSSSTVYGKVTAIDGAKITLALGTMLQGGGAGGTPPSKPSGKPSDSTSSNSSTTASNTNAMPSGAAPSGMPGTPPSGGMGGSPFTENGKTSTITISDESIIKTQEGNSTKSASLSDIKVGSILCIAYATDGSLSTVTIQQAGMGGQGGPGGDGSASGSQSGSITLTGAYSVSGSNKTVKNKTIKSTKANQNAVLVKKSGKLTISGAKLSKTGNSTSVDESNFYALNAAVAAISKGSIKISNSKVTSAAEGSNALFASGTGSKITASNVIINTTGNSSRGLDATYGGTVVADKMKITTKGAHCAPVATDRGEGYITITNSTLSASGDGSPCIYSTGTIKATNVIGKATGSQAAVIEGKNSITLDKCNLTGVGKNGIMIYQSTSGDAAVGVGKLSSTDSTLTSTSTGEMFYITNTDAEIDLTNTTLNFTSGILLNAAGNSTNNWGTPGSNGGKVTFNATKQTLVGDITCDKISKVTFSLKSGSSFKGAIDTANTGDVTISLDASSTWTVTKDSYVTAISDSDTTLSNIVSNGHIIYYDSSNVTNSWLNGKTVSLADGGKLTPIQ